MTNKVTPIFHKIKLRTDNTNTILVNIHMYVMFVFINLKYQENLLLVLQNRNWFFERKLCTAKPNTIFCTTIVNIFVQNWGMMSPLADRYVINHISTLLTEIKLKWIHLCYIYMHARIALFKRKFQVPYIYCQRNGQQEVIKSNLTGFNLNCQNLLLTFIPIIILYFSGWNLNKRNFFNIRRSRFNNQHGPSLIRWWLFQFRK
jgi:hypothetical protein